MQHHATPAVLDLNRLTEALADYGLPPATIATTIDAALLPAGWPTLRDTLLEARA